MSPTSSQNIHTTYTLLTILLSGHQISILVVSIHHTPVLMMSDDVLCFVYLRDARLSEKLQLDAELSLDKAVAQVRQAEAVKQQQSLVRGAEENRRQPDTHVGAVLRRRGPSQTKLSQRSDQSGADKTGKGSKSTCGWCGKSPSHAKQQCPAKDAVCHKCSKHGHFQAVAGQPN